MSTSTLRFPNPALRAPTRSKPVPRGASRLVVKQPRKLKVHTPDFSLVKRIFWPVLLVLLLAAGLSMGDRVIPLIDRPISKIMVRGELSHDSRQLIEQLVAPYAGSSFIAADMSKLRADLEQMPWIFTGGSSARLARSGPGEPAGAVADRPLG